MSSPVPSNQYHLPLHAEPARLDEGDEEPVMTRKRADSWYLRLFNLHATKDQQRRAESPNSNNMDLSARTQPSAATEQWQQRSRISNSTQVQPSSWTEDYDNDDDYYLTPECLLDSDKQSPTHPDSSAKRAYNTEAAKANLSGFAFTLFGVTPPPRSPRLEIKRPRSTRVKPSKAEPLANDRSPGPVYVQDPYRRTHTATTREVPSSPVTPHTSAKIVVRSKSAAHEPKR